MAIPLPFTDKLQKLVEDIPDLEVSEYMIYCIVCKVHLRCWHKGHCLRHIRNVTHIHNKNQEIPLSEFWVDLCMLICACGLSFNVLDNPCFRLFWKKYVPQWELPSAQHIRQVYLPRVFNTIMDNIKSEVKDKYIYVTVSETSDQQLNKVVHVLVRCLEMNGVSPPYLISSKRGPTMTAETIARVVESALLHIDIANERVLLFVTDAAPYMKNAGIELKRQFPHMIHVTCLAHSLHRVIEEIHKQYPDVDNFLFATKDVLSKSADRRRAFRDTLPNVPLPPDPVCTQWATWLWCVIYYEQHFETVKRFFMMLNADESKAIATSQHYFQNGNIFDDIQKIAKQYSCLPTAILKLESEALSLQDTLSTVHGVRDAISVYSDSQNKAVLKKLQTVLNNNPGYATMVQIQEDLQSVVKDSEHHSNFYHYGPLTCVDVERSFSEYKAVVRTNRSRLSERTIEYILVVLQYTRSLQHPFNTTE